MAEIKADSLAEFRKLALDHVGKIYVNRFEDSVRVLILRGPSSLCAYLGIPIDHPLAGNSYDDLRISCNGGLTYGGESKTESEKNIFPIGHFWYGWDYSHCDDLSFYDLDRKDGLPTYRTKAWTVADVEGEMWLAVYDMKHLMTIAENAFAKGAKWRAAAAKAGA